MDDEDIAVLVVDDHPRVRLAIEALIARTPGQRVVGSVSSGAAAIERVARLQPTVLVIDPGMPGMNGVEATREIRKRKAAPILTRASCGAKREPPARHTRSSRTRTPTRFWKRSAPRLDSREASDARGRQVRVGRRRSRETNPT